MNSYFQKSPHEESPRTQMAVPRERRPTFRERGNTSPPQTPAENRQEGRRPSAAARRPQPWARVLHDRVKAMEPRPEDGSQSRRTEGPRPRARGPGRPAGQSGKDGRHITQKSLRGEKDLEMLCVSPSAPPRTGSLNFKIFKNIWFSECVWCVCVSRLVHGPGKCHQGEDKGEP